MSVEVAADRRIKLASGACKLLFSGTLFWKSSSVSAKYEINCKHTMPNSTIDQTMLQICSF
jgi:hypothetical protein